MPLPRVAIVGRPNVGKSSLLNWLAGKRISVVDDVAGVTRDRVSAIVEHDGGYYEFIDTGGIGFEDPDNLSAHIDEQIRLGIDVADAIVFLCDVRTEVTTLDRTVADRLRKLDKPTILVVNKVDHAKYEPEAEAFRTLGAWPLVTISCEQKRGRDELFDALTAAVTPGDDAGEGPAATEMKLAIVGRRNVGKSTFVNTLAGEMRMIVSEIPGTTRDSVDVRFTLDGKSFTAIDTPGVKRQKSLSSNVEFYSLHRAQRSIRRADVVLHFFDCTQGIAKLDKQLVKEIAAHHKPHIFVVNKWDLLVGERPTSDWVEYIRNTFPMSAYAPIAFTTGMTGKNVKALLNHAQMLFKQAQARVGTGELNRLMSRIVERTPPPLHHNRRPKILYTTQVAVAPPTLVVMTTEPAGFTADYQRYVVNMLRDEVEFAEVPIRMFFQERDETRRDEARQAGR